MANGRTMNHHLSDEEDVLGVEEGENGERRGTGNESTRFYGHRHLRAVHLLDKHLPYLQ